MISLGPNFAPIEEQVRETLTRWLNSSHELERCPTCDGSMSGAPIAKEELRILEIELQRIVGEFSPRVRVTEYPPGSRRVAIWQDGKRTGIAQLEGVGGDG